MPVRMWRTGFVPWAPGRRSRLQPESGSGLQQSKGMTKTGQEIIKLAFANEDKPGIVARMVLELLA